MKTPKWPLVAALSLATIFLVSCDDGKDTRISDADAMCLKMLRNGGNCGGANGATGGTSTVTNTATTTVTNSSTVTITQTGS